MTPWEESGRVEPAGAPLGRLVDLPRGRMAVVTELAVESGLAHRLGALGLRPGRILQVLRRAPLAGPIHLQVGMTELMLRRRDAARIQVRLRDITSAGSGSTPPPAPGDLPPVPMQPGP